MLFERKMGFPVALFLLLVFFGTAAAEAQTAQPDTLPAAPAQAGTLEAILTRVTELLSASKYNEAIALFDTIPAPERDTPRIKLLKASVLSSAGKQAEARALAEAVSVAEPRNIDALFILAAIEETSGRRRQQQSALERIIRLEPDNTEALVSLGNLSLQARARQPAASYFHRALQKEPENPDALIGLSRAFRMNQEWERAEAILHRAVQLHPGMAETRTERARFYWGRGFLIQALEDIDEAKKISPDDYWIAIDRGNLLLEMNRKSQALEEFNRAAAINPNEYRAYAYTAGLKDDLGDFDGAERDYAILARLNPEYYYGLEGLGLHKMRKNSWAEARDAFMGAYRYAPEENFYALLAAIGWMRAEGLPAPRTFLAQAHTRVKRDTLEWYMFRLYYDLTARNYAAESDVAIRLDRETDQTLKARMLFYMAMYYDIRGNTALANKYFLLVSELDKRAIPEWRLNEWILTDRDLKVFD